MTLFENLPWALLGLAIFFGGLIAAWIVKQLVLLVLVCNTPTYPHGTKRNMWVNIVNLIALSLQIIIVTTGIFVAFHVAGVNFFSLAVSVGVISLVFTFAGQGLITNSFAALCIYGTDKVEIGDYIEMGNSKGYVSALRPLWVEITDGTSVTHIPNATLLAVPFTVKPNGPNPPATPTPVPGNGGRHNINIPGTTATYTITKRQ